MYLVRTCERSFVPCDKKQMNLHTTVVVKGKSPFAANPAHFNSIENMALAVRERKCLWPATFQIGHSSSRVCCYGCCCHDRPWSRPTVLATDRGHARPGPCPRSAVLASSDDFDGEGNSPATAVTTETAVSCTHVGWNKVHKQTFPIA